MEVNSEKGDRLRRVGLVYDDRMCKHATADGDPHPENPDRIRAIWKKLESAGIPQRCVVFNAKEAEDKHILSVHSNNHVNLIKNISSKQFDSRRNRIASKFNSIYMNEGSSEAAYLAAGSVIEVAERVAKGELSSAFAIVRPPGHHAEQNEPMGFCLYNNVAIATSFLLNERPDIKKILIVDWDVHHGNGTQKMFWKDPRVLFFSVHRHEFGSFYPANNDGFYAMTGEGPGAGYNINVPWENGRCGDADYLAVWDHILIPVAKDFNPDIVIISAGFDAAIGDPLGGCHVTPYGYSVMLKKLMEFAEGKIIMALEGGYNLVSLANSVLACVEVLLEDKPIAGSSEAYPFESTWRVIQAVRQELSAFWPTLADELPKKLTSCKASPLQLVSGVPVKGPAAGRSRLACDLKSGISGRFQDRLLETIEVSCSSAQEGHPEIDGEDRADPVLVPDEGSPEDIQPAVNEEGPASREEPHHNDSSGGSPVDDAACTSASPFSYVELGEMLKQIPPGSDVALPSAKMFEMAEMLVSGIRGMVQQRDLFSDLLWITDHMKAFISHRMSGEEELRSRLEQAEANLKRSQDNNEALRIELEEAKSREAATEARLHEAEDKTAQLRGGVRQLRTEVSIEKKQKEDLQLRLIAQKEELEAEFAVQREELETEYQKQVDEMYFFGYHCCMKKNGIKRDVPSIPPGEEEKLRRKPSQ